MAFVRLKWDSAFTFLKFKYKLSKCKKLKNVRDYIFRVVRMSITIFSR